jgi:hypothetical protein
MKPAASRWVNCDAVIDEGAFSELVVDLSVHWFNANHRMADAFPTETRGAPGRGLGQSRYKI